MTSFSLVMMDESKKWYKKEIKQIPSALLQVRNKRAMMALDHSPESFSQQNQFYLLCSYCSNLWPQGWGQFWPWGHHMNKINKGPRGDATYQQEGQDGPGSLTWFFEIALASFFFSRFQRRIYKNFFMSVQCKKPPFTNTMFIDRSKFQEQFWKGSLKEHFYKITSKSDR